MEKREIRVSREKSRNILEVSLFVGNSHSLVLCGNNPPTSPHGCSASDTPNGIFLHASSSLLFHLLQTCNEIK